MILNTEICDVKNQANQKNLTVKAVQTLTVGLLPTLILLFLNQSGIFTPSLDLVFAPLLVSILLAFGDNLLIYFLLKPVIFLFRDQTQNTNNTLPKNNTNT